MYSESIDLLVHMLPSLLERMWECRNNFLHWSNGTRSNILLLSALKSSKRKREKRDPG